MRRQIDTMATRVLINDDAAPHSLAITWARSRLKRGEARGPRLGSRCLRRRFARAAAGGDTGQRLETCTPAARSSRVRSELPAPDFCRSSPPPPAEDHRCLARPACGLNETRDAETWTRNERRRIWGMRQRARRLQRECEWESERASKCYDLPNIPHFFYWVRSSEKQNTFYLYLKIVR